MLEKNATYDQATEIENVLLLVLDIKLLIVEMEKSMHERLVLHVLWMFEIFVFSQVSHLAEIEK
jgi:hypothetical protein